jgi:hypothetical protein
MNVSYLVKNDQMDFDIFESKRNLFDKLFDESNLFIILPTIYNTRINASKADGWLIPRIERKLFQNALKTNDDLLDFKKVTLSDFLLLERGNLVDDEDNDINFEIWSTQMNCVTNERSMDRQFCLVSKDWANEIDRLKSEDDESRKLQAELQGYTQKMREIQEKLNKKKSAMSDQKQMEKWTELEDKKNAERNTEIMNEIDQIDLESRIKAVRDEPDSEESYIGEPVTQDAVTEDGQILQVTYFPTKEN